jgi:hypothetical protein
MNKRRTATILTVAILAGSLGIALGRKNQWGLADLRAMAYRLKPVVPEPQDTVYAMLSAARSGNIKSYLTNFTGAMGASLRQTLRESGEAAFAGYLIQSNAEIKGVAVGDAQVISDSEVKVRVETIYQDRNVVQNMYLEREAAGWKISRTDSDERVTTLVPYGTPVK